MPLFSVIAVTYQGSIPHDIFRRGIASIQAQTFTDYELICLHDGPLLDPKAEMPCPVTCTDKHYNDWGHSPHDIGMKMATGDYILNFNCDNILYPNALEEIAKEIRRPARFPENPDIHRLDENNIVIFPVKAFGLNRVFGRYTAQVTDHSFFEVLTGNPPANLNIDTLQLVMKRSLWLAEGGWYDKQRNSDGVLYPAFCKKYGYRIVGPILGERY
jgi:hypothetical protein